MNIQFDIYSIACITVMGLYILLICFICIGWIKTPSFRSLRSDFKTRVSIIIAARNEEKNIADCLQHILKQNFPKELLEIIVVDDHSEDNTREIVEGIKKGNSVVKLISLVHSRNNISFKKEAIQQGIDQSSGELLITTDADCVMEDRWLETVVSFYEEKKPEMIISPVSFKGERFAFEKMQALEFAGLIITGGGSSYFNAPLLCNGANLAYTKSGFIKAGRFDDIMNSSSGDDVLLMLKINSLFPGKVQFLKSIHACVYTRPVKGFRAFLDQRARWASKKAKNVSAFYNLAALTVFLFNLLIASTLLLTIFLHKYLIILGILFAGKCLFDFLLLFLAASFFKKKNFLLYFIPEQMVYSFYIIIASVLGMVKKYEWKGRAAQ